jgi:hypothetical protein
VPEADLHPLHWERCREECLFLQVADRRREEVPEAAAGAPIWRLLPMDEGTRLEETTEHLPIAGTDQSTGPMTVPAPPGE